MRTGSSNALSTNCFRGATKNSSFHINSGCTTYPRNLPSLDVGSNLSPSLTRFFLGPFPKCTWHPKGLVERSLLRGTSCLHGQFSVEQPPLFHQPFPQLQEWRPWLRLTDSEQPSLGWSPGVPDQDACEQRTQGSHTFSFPCLLQLCDIHSNQREIALQFLT